MSLNHARYKAENKERENTTDSKNVMILKQGKNYIRVFKFKHTVTNRDFTLGLYKRGEITSPKVGEVVEEIARPFRVHMMKGQKPIMCYLDKNKCDMCEAASDAMAENPKSESARMMRSSRRYALLVVNADKPEEGLKRMDLSDQPFSRLIEQYQSKMEDGVDEDSIFGPRGRDFIVNWNKEADVDKRYMVTIRDKEICKTIEPEGKVWDLFDDSSLDPQDAPPKAGQPDRDEDGRELPWNAKDEPAPNPKEALAQAEKKNEEVRKKYEEPPQKPKKLEDKKPSGPETLVGKKVKFDNGEGIIVTAIVEQDKGSTFVARSTSDGKAWELDKTEKFDVV